MELVIKLDDKIYQDIIEGNRRERYSIVMYDFPITIADAIAEGIPLHEGHGKLIDADVLREDFKTSKKITFAELMNISCIVDHAPTIIEADKENDNETDN